MPDPAITPHSHHHNHIPDTSNDIQPPLFDSSNVGYGLGYDYSSPYQRKIAKRRKIVFIVVPVIMVSIFALIAGLLAWHFNQASKQAQEDAYNNHNWPN
jgi:hypothetical protein